MLDEIGDDVICHVAADVVVMVLGNREVLDEALLFQPVKGVDDAEIILRLVNGMVAEMKFEHVVIPHARARDSVLDELVMLLLVNVPLHVVAADAVHHDFEMIRFARLALDRVGHGVGGPAMRLVPVVHAGLDGERDDIGAPVGRAHERADFQAGPAVAAARQLATVLGGGGNI